jgi:O-antigen/teichoic acid export membrane protein
VTTDAPLPVIDPNGSNSPSTMRRDVVSAYIASGSKIASWAIVSALVYRRIGEHAFAALALARATVGVVNYASFGIAPALIHHLSRATAGNSLRAEPFLTERFSTATPVLTYANLQNPDRQPSPLQQLYDSGLSILLVAAFFAGLALIPFANLFGRELRTPIEVGTGMNLLVFLVGMAVVFRLISDASSAILQVTNRIALDNTLLAATEWIWVILTALTIGNESQDVVNVGKTLLASSGFLLLARFFTAERIAPLLNWKIKTNWVMGRTLLRFGALVTLAQVADYLYAPTDYLLINQLLEPSAVATYAPAVQIDAALLTLAVGLSSVLLAKSAAAHARRNSHLLRRYYIAGTITTLALLLVAALLVWPLSPWIFKLWLGSSMHDTRVILPLILIHTVVGGSSAVGRSILLGMGKVKPFTIAVLIAGVSNVMLSYVFVRYFNLGLKGIVLGTIIAVVGRCAIWMPWYTLREINRTMKSER